MEKPYVVSAELDLWLPDRDDIISQDQLDPFRISLDDDLRSQGKQTEWVESTVLRDGICKKLDNTSLPTLSLDDRYATNVDGVLGISRGVDENLDDVGYVPRVGYRSIEEQFESIRCLGDEVVLVDDVLFSGEMAVWLTRQLDKLGIKVRGVICGIAIGESVQSMAAIGVDVDAVKYYEDVEDEICERDFAIVPGSGRRIASLGKSALYFDPIYGRPAQWASIEPASVAEFALNSYARNQQLLSGDVRGFFGVEDGSAQLAIEEKLKQLEAGRY